MKKRIYTDANEDLINSCSGKTTTLIENYKNIKEAGTSALARDILEQYKPDKDHFACHIIALGDYETYGHNRNADSFPKEANVKHHGTFVSDAHLFREHNNSDPKNAIGSIKYAMYNPDMKRVELIVWGHKKKASEEWDLVKSGKEISGSMGCYVPHDRDNISGKLCSNPSQYEPWMKRAAGQYIESWQMPNGETKKIGKFACVHNDNPRFIDYSIVKNPADRIAYYLEYIPGDEMSKTASSNCCTPSALLPESRSIYIDGMFFNKEKASMLKASSSLESELDEYISSSQCLGQKEDFIDNLMSNAFDEHECISDEDIQTLRGVNTSVLMNELASRGIMLPFKDFTRYAFNKTEPEIANDRIVIYANNVMLPNMYNQAESQLGGVFDEHMFDSCMNSTSKLDINNTSEIQSILDGLMESLSIKDECLMPRMIRVAVKKKPTVRMKIIKIANDSMNYSLSKEELSIAAKYIKEYANYKIACKKDINDKTNISTKAIDILDIVQNIGLNNK